VLEEKRVGAIDIYPAFMRRKEKNLLREKQRSPGTRLNTMKRLSRSRNDINARERKESRKKS